MALSITKNASAEIDYYWKKLSAGGKKIACGWLKDKFGVAWQIVPENITDLISSKDPEQSDRVVKAVMQMVKLDIGKLEQAYAQEPRKNNKRETKRKK